MNSLKNQILNLFQEWLEKNYPVDYESYKDELKKASELLTRIYNLVKNYGDKMTWDEFKKAEPANEWDFHKCQQTKITCPICGKFIYKRMDIVLATYPPKYRYECKCGWVGFSYN